MLFNHLEELLPNHDIIRMKIMYHIFNEWNKEVDNVLSCCIYPISIDGTGKLADNDMMWKFQKELLEVLEDTQIAVYPSTNNLYFNCKWNEAVEFWKSIRNHLNIASTTDDRVTINYHVNSTEYEIIISGNEDFPYTSVILVELKDISLLKILGFNDLSVVTNHLKTLQFNEDGGSLSITVSFIRMLSDPSHIVPDTDTDGMIDQIKEVLASTPDILIEDMKSLSSDKSEE